MVHKNDAVYKEGMKYVVEVSIDNHEISYLHSRPIEYHEAQNYQRNFEILGYIAVIRTW